MKQFHSIFVISCVKSLERRRKMKKSIIALILAIVIQSCVSTDKTHKDYFGYNNNPNYEEPKREPTKSEYPVVHSESQTKKERSTQNEPIIIYNYNFPAPYEPRYLFYPEPNDFGLFLYFGNIFYDPFWDYNLIYYPHHRHHHRIVYYPYPYYYWDDYYWYRRPRVIYIPYENEKEPPKTVRTFGPSRGDYNYDDKSTPTKESRSSSRGGERNKIAPPSDSKDAVEKPVKLKLPEKNNTPSNSPERSNTRDSAPKETPTKQERSSTRPK